MCLCNEVLIPFNIPAHCIAVIDVAQIRQRKTPKNTEILSEISLCAEVFISKLRKTIEKQPQTNREKVYVKQLEGLFHKR